jgi:spore coat protein U-like protein
MSVHARSLVAGSVLAVLVAAGGSASAQTCRFISNPGGVGFGVLDPSLPSTRTATTTARMTCQSLNVTPTWQFAGANGSAHLRMRHASRPEFVPYTAAASYLGNTGITQSWRVTATVLGASYENASAGTYADQLTITILP